MEDCNIFEPGASYRLKPDATLGARVMARSPRHDTRSTNRPQKLGKKGEGCLMPGFSLTSSPRCGRIDPLFGFGLAEVEGLPHQGIATILDLSVGAMKTHLHRARLFLREGLAAYCVERRRTVL